MTYLLNLPRSLLHDALSNQDYILSDNWIIVNNEFRRMWKEAVVASFKVIIRYLPGEKPRNFCHDSQCPGRDSNWAPPEYVRRVTSSGSLLGPSTVGGGPQVALRKVTKFYK
jgi:hypothetical protein